jgi:O-antigen/teichoic acid export membrane protein
LTPQDTRSGSVSARVISASLWVFGSQILTLLLVFIAQRIILSTLDPTSNGTLFLERRLTEVIVGIMADFGMNGIVVRRVAQEPERAQQILASAFYVRLALWSVCTLIVGLAGLFSQLALADVILWAIYMLIASRTALLRYTLETRLRAASDFRMPSLLAVADALLFVALIAFWRDVLSPSVVIQAFVLSAIPGFAVLIAIDRGRSTSWSNASGMEMRAIVSEALPVVAATILLAVHDKIDAFLVESFSGRAHVGVLGAAYTTLGPLLAVIPMAVSYAAMPDVARLLKSDESKGLDVAVGVMRHLLLISLIVTAAATIIMPVFVNIVTKGRYLQSLDLFIWFVWSAPFVALLVYAQELSVALGRQRNLLRIAAALVVSTIGFGAILIPGMSALGAVVAKIITSVVGAGVSLYLLQRTLSGRTGAWFVLQCLFVTLLAAGAAWGLADTSAGASTSTPTHLLMLFVRMLAAAAVVVIGALGVGLLTRADVARLGRGLVGARLS